jgi:hypothetical protein
MLIMRGVEGGWQGCCEWVFLVMDGEGIRVDGRVV